MGRLITWGYLEPLEKGALCLHTHMYTHTHTHTHTKSLLTPNFALSPNFREGAEVNTSTIKAFFEQNRSIILWVSRVQISFLFLTQLLLLWGEREMEKNCKRQYSETELFTFSRTDVQGSHPTRQRDISSVACGSVRLSRWSAPRWRRAEGHAARIWRSAGAWGRLWSCSQHAFLPRTPPGWALRDDRAVSPAGGGQLLYCHSLPLSEIACVWPSEGCVPSSTLAQWRQGRSTELGHLPVSVGKPTA